MWAYYTNQMMLWGNWFQIIDNITSCCNGDTTYYTYYFLGKYWQKSIGKQSLTIDFKVFFMILTLESIAPPINEAEHGLNLDMMYL